MIKRLLRVVFVAVIPVLGFSLVACSTSTPYNGPATANSSVPNTLACKALDSFVGMDVTGESYAIQAPSRGVCKVTDSYSEEIQLTLQSGDGNIYSGKDVYEAYADALLYSGLCTSPPQYTVPQSQSLAPDNPQYMTYCDIQNGQGGAFYYGGYGFSVSATASDGNTNVTNALGVAVDVVDYLKQR